jgi:hypothetical protein
MATRLYFDNASNPLRGTFPTGEQSASTPNWSVTTATTLRTLDLQIGGAQASLAGSTGAGTSQKLAFLGFFCSAPLKGAQTVGGGSIILNAAETETDLRDNFWVNALCAYIWRPSTGAKVGTYILDSAGASLGGTEPATANDEEVTHITGIASTGISASDGDVIIVEVWAVHTKSQTSARTCTWYYDGTTENTSENAVVTNHASFIEFTENLNFYRRTFVGS